MNLKVSYIVNSVFSSRTYALSCDGSTDVWLVDCGDWGRIDDNDNDDERLNNFIAILRKNGLGTDNIIVVGSKRYGISNGQIYARHHKPDYWDATVVIGKEYFTKNEEFKSKWGERYIDMVTPVFAGGHSVRVFSDDHKYISQDTEHFTEGGAKYYARLLKPVIMEQIEWCKHNYTTNDIQQL